MPPMSQPDSPDPTNHDFADRYATGQTPWEIGEPQPPFVQHAALVESPVLDLGCGTGELAVYFASLGHAVVGVDPEAEAVNAARGKAAAAGVDATFEVGSAQDLAQTGRTYATILDCLLFHIFDDQQRTQYVDSVRAALRPGGRLLMLVFSDAEPPGNGPRRISERELRDCFADKFEIETIEPVRLVMRPEDAGLFSEGGPHGLWAVIRRTGDGA